MIVSPHQPTADPGSGLSFSPSVLAPSSTQGSSVILEASKPSSQEPAQLFEPSKPQNSVPTPPLQSPPSSPQPRQAVFHQNVCHPVAGEQVPDPPKPFALSLQPKEQPPLPTELKAEPNIFRLTRMIPTSPRGNDDESGACPNPDERILTRKPRQLSLSRPGGEDTTKPDPTSDISKAPLEPLKEPNQKEQRQEVPEKEIKTKPSSQKQIGLSLKGSKLNSLRRGPPSNERLAKQSLQASVAENQRLRSQSVETSADHNVSNAPQDSRNRAQSLSSVITVPSFGSIKWPTGKKKAHHWEDIVKTNQEAEDLCEAVWRGDLQETQRILEHSLCPDLINIPNHRGQTALYCASRQGFVEIVQYLLKYDSINLNPQVEAHGNTPMHDAAFYNHAEVVALLVAAGASLAIKNKLKITPRHFAEGPEVIELFDHYDFEGLNGLIARYPRVSFMLDANPATTNRKLDNDKRELFLLLYVFFPGSQMTWFVISKTVTIIEAVKPACLIRNINLDEHVFTDSNNNILKLDQVACKVPNQTVLITPHSQVEPSKSCGPRYLSEQLCLTIQANDLDSFQQQLTLHSHKTINEPNGRGQTPLYCAAKLGNPEMVIALLNFEGILVDKADLLFGSTPLHVACFNDFPQIVAMLLFAGASMHVKNKLQHSPRSESGSNARMVFPLAQAGIDAIEKHWPICGRIKRDSCLTQNLPALLPVSVSVPMVPLYYKTTLPSRINVKMVKDIVLMKLSLLKTGVNRPEDYFFVANGQTLRDTAIIGLSVEPNDTLQFLRRFNYQLSSPVGTLATIKPEETVKLLLEKLAPGAEIVVIGLAYCRATSVSQEFDLMQPSATFCSYQLSSQDSLRLVLVGAEPISFNIDYSPFDSLEHQKNVVLVRHGLLSYRDKPGSWKTTQFDLQNNQLSYKDDSHQPVHIDLESITAIKNATKLFQKGFFYLQILTIANTELTLRMQTKQDYDNWLFPLIELRRISDFYTLGKVQSSETADPDDGLIPKIALTWQIKDMNFSKWKNTNKNFFSKKLNQSDYQKFMSFFRSKLFGKGIHVREIQQIYTPHLVSSFNNQRKNISIRHKNSPQIFSAETWRKAQDHEQKNWVFEQYKKRVSEFSWNTGKELPVLPVLHGTDAKTSELICESGFTTVASSRDLGYFGQGMYFSSNANYILPYFGVKRDPVIVLAFLAPGNIYPVTEDHTSDKSLIGTPLKRGFQCHFIVTTKKGAVSTDRVATDCDEFVVFQESQVIPAYVLTIDRDATLETIKKLPPPTETHPELLTNTAFKKYPPQEVEPWTLTTYTKIAQDLSDLPATPEPPPLQSSPGEIGFPLQLPPQPPPPIPSPSALSALPIPITPPDSSPPPRPPSPHTRPLPSPSQPRPISPRLSAETPSLPCPPRSPTQDNANQSASPTASFLEMTALANLHWGLGKHSEPTQMGQSHPTQSQPSLASPVPNITRPSAGQTPFNPPQPLITPFPPITESTANPVVSRRVSSLSLAPQHDIDSP